MGSEAPDTKVTMVVNHARLTIYALNIVQIREKEATALVGSLDKYLQARCVGRNREVKENLLQAEKVSHGTDCAWFDLKEADLAVTTDHELDGGEVHAQLGHFWTFDPERFNNDVGGHIGLERLTQSVYVPDGGDIATDTVLAENLRRVECIDPKTTVAFVPLAVVVIVVIIAAVIFEITVGDQDVS